MNLQSEVEEHMVDEIADRITQRGDAAVLGVDHSALALSTTNDDVESWDSFAQLNLMVAIEDEFGLELDPEQFANLYHLGELVDRVAALLES